MDNQWSQAVLFSLTITKTKMIELR